MQLQRDSSFLVKLSLVLFIIIAAGFILYIGQDILVPIALAGLLAVLLLPANRFLEKRIGRVASILISLVVFFLLFGTLLYFLITQITGFIDDIPTIKRQLNKHLYTVQRWVYENFHLTRKEQSKFIEEGTTQIKETNGGGGIIGKTFLSLTEFLFVVILMPIYTFLILYYRDMIRQFLVDLFKTDHRQKVFEVINESRVIVYNYMVGLSIEMAIITAINTIGFLIVGIKYALFLGLLSAVLNLIPYVGMLIASIFCMLVTLTSSQDLTDIIWVLVVLLVVQFFDNNIIMPKVVGSKVKINALITILGVVIGGALCGLSGMFLSIPIIAIMKVIFDRVDGLKPWGRMLGDEISYSHKLRLYRRLADRKTKKELKATA
ncbi:MAG TPA: AI-2E family transporter [Segetibacter sp.]|jgi:predicted PurR-regulated permease PerM